MPRTIERKAIGRFARLGDLYDVRSDSFTSDSIFLRQLSKSDIKRDDCNSVNIEFIYSDSLSDKYHKLDIEAELQISLLAGMVKLSGSGAYLNEKSTSQKKKRMSLVYNVRAAREHISIRSIRDKIDIESLKDSNATHVVVEIEWGARCTITCETDISTSSEDSKVNGALKAEISKLGVGISGGARTDVKDKSNENNEKFTYFSKCDVSDLGQDLPVTQKEAIQAAKKLPSVVKNTNEGKGVPMVFHLMPLTEVVKMCKLQLKINAVLQDIQEHIVTQSVQFYEEVQNRQRKINDVHDDFKRSEDYISDEELAAIESLNNGFKVFQSKLQGEMADTLVKIRSKEKDVSELQALITRCQNDVNFSESAVRKTLRQHGWINNKIATIEKCIARGIKYIGRKDVILDITENAEHVYVLYFDEKIRTSRKDAWEKNFSFYLRLSNTHSQDDNFAFVMMDLQLRPEKKKHNDVPLPYIVHYQDGQPICKDVLEKEGKDRDLCLIDLSNGELRTKPMPKKRASVKILCANAINGACQATPQKWMCKKCKSDVAYGMDDKMLYCTGKCRRVAHQSQITFRCSDPSHGVAFVPFPDQEVLKDELSKLRPLKQTNILILGETGVGKSTWINGIANYICFDSLEEAEKNEFYTPIASKFSVTDDQGESVDIFVGRKEDNEIFTPRESATQYPKAHLIHLEDKLLCLIDTPGIGDSRGPTQDKKNFQNILTHLSNYDEIHGICILLKPNNARLTVMFRFCINELLTHLHRSAAANIVFCFTNCRGTMYRPGDTLPALKRYLGENELVKIDLTPTTYYCFDNEAFRFLACLKNGQRYDKNIKRLYSESWNKSADETFRLFNHVEQLWPHRVKETSTLNDTRRIIIELNQPIAEVVKVIQTNLVMAKDYGEKIARRDKEVKLLEKDLILTLSRTLTNETAHKELIKKRSDKEKIENALKQREVLIKEFQKEKKRILEISNEFGHFLKTHSIVPYNDAVEEYLEMSIKAEEGKDPLIRNKDMIEKMKEDLKGYKETNASIKEAMKTNDPNFKVPTNDEIKQMRDELCRLKHFGDSFKKALKTISQCNEIHFAYQMGTPLQPPRRPIQKKPRSKQKRNFFQKVGNLVTTGAWE